MLLRRIKENSKKGFTLAELLVVVAIIAILVAVSIPIFTGKLEETRETTDIANMRAAKAAALEAFLSEDYKETWSKRPERQYAAVFDADKGIFVSDDSYGKPYGKGTEKNSGMTYNPNEAPFDAQSNIEGKLYYVYDGSKSYKGFMIEALIIEASDQIIIRWFNSVTE